MNGKFEYAFFDFDGVIVDSEPIRMDTYKNLFLEVYGVDIDIDKYSMVGKSENHNLANLLKINNLDNDPVHLLRSIYDNLYE
jgi:beta-phosphoglucomutase-like phosphatase (HAD superfamily)